MFSNAIRNLKPIHGYPQAVRHFQNMRRPRSTKWMDNERPLYKVSTPHYCLTQGPLLADGTAAYYDCVLYQTPMVRYFKPRGDGEHVIYLRAYDSSASWQYLEHVANFYSGKTVRSVNGEQAQLPLNPLTSLEFVAPNGITVPQGWSALLRRNADGDIYFDHSAHRPVYRKVTSDKRRAQRAEFAAYIRPYVELLLLRLPLFHANAQVSSRMGRPFSKTSTVDPAQHSILAVLDEMPPELSELQFEALSGVMQWVYNKSLSQWMWNYDGHTEGLASADVYQALTWKPTPAPTSIPPLPVERMRKAFTDVLMRVVGSATGDAREEIPQFPTELPRTRYFW